MFLPISSQGAWRRRRADRHAAGRSETRKRYIDLRGLSRLIKPGPWSMSRPRRRGDRRRRTQRPVRSSPGAAGTAGGRRRGAAGRMKGRHDGSSPAHDAGRLQPGQAHGADAERTAHRGGVPRAPPRGGGSHPGLLRSGRELSARPRRLHRQPHRPCHLLPRELRRLHGGRRRAGDRHSGHLPRQPRSRRHQRRHRAPHCGAGRGAHDPVRGPGGAAEPAPRVLPGDRLRPHVFRHLQVGGRGQRSRAPALAPRRQVQRRLIRVPSPPRGRCAGPRTPCARGRAGGRGGGAGTRPARPAPPTPAESPSCRSR